MALEFFNGIGHPFRGDEESWVLEECARQFEALLVKLEKGNAESREQVKAARILRLLTTARPKGRPKELRRALLHEMAANIDWLAAAHHASGAKNPHRAALKEWMELTGSANIEFKSIETYYRKSLALCRKADVEFAVRVDEAAKTIVNESGADWKSAVAQALHSKANNYPGAAYVCTVSYGRGKRHLRRAAPKKPEKK